MEAIKFNRVKKYRIMKKMSVKQLAAAIGRTEAYVRQIESGTRGLTIETGLQICKALGKGLDTIFLP